MQDGGQSAQPADRRELFKPAFRHLVSLIQERVKYPAGFEKWQKDDRADFKDMRYAVADTLCDAARKTLGLLSSASVLAWLGLQSTTAATSIHLCCFMLCSDCRGICLHPVSCIESQVAAQANPGKSCQWFARSDDSCILLARCSLACLLLAEGV